MILTMILGGDGDDNACDDFDNDDYNGGVNTNRGNGDRRLSQIDEMD